MRESEREKKRWIEKRERETIKGNSIIVIILKQRKRGKNMRAKELLLDLFRTINLQETV